MHCRSRWMFKWKKMRSTSFQEDSNQPPQAPNGSASILKPDSIQNDCACLQLRKNPRIGTTINENPTKWSESSWFLPAFCAAMLIPGDSSSDHSTPTVEDYTTDSENLKTNDSWNCYLALVPHALANTEQIQTLAKPWRALITTSHTVLNLTHKTRTIFRKRVWSKTLHSRTLLPVVPRPLKWRCKEWIFSAEIPGYNREASPPSCLEPQISIVQTVTSTTPRSN